MPFIGIYLRIQPWLKVDSFVSFPIFKNLFCQDSSFNRVSPWLVKIMMQTVEFSLVRVGHIDNYIFVNI